jgi:hypothetical protein
MQDPNHGSEVRGAIRRLAVSKNVHGLVPVTAQAPLGSKRRLKSRLDNHYSFEGAAVWHSGTALAFCVNMCGLGILCGCVRPWHSVRMCATLAFCADVCDLGILCRCVRPWGGIDFLSFSVSQFELSNKQIANPPNIYLFLVHDIFCSIIFWS